jgi:hypothetical protein
MEKERSIREMMRDTGMKEDQIDIQIKQMMETLGANTEEELTDIFNRVDKESRKQEEEAKQKARENEGITLISLIIIALAYQITLGVVVSTQSWSGWGIWIIWANVTSIYLPISFIASILVFWIVTQVIQALNAMSNLMLPPPTK